MSDAAARIQKLGIGFCQPKYFIFNMRADGHIIPKGRLANPDAK